MARQAQPVERQGAEVVERGAQAVRGQAVGELGVGLRLCALRELAMSALILARLASIRDSIASFSARIAVMLPLISAIAIAFRRSSIPPTQAPDPAGSTGSRGAAGSSRADFS
ncbi:MAG: hypothetical protein OXD36_02340 [Rhodobacter sp.]|nr:hypothetical protein [Rhodobacter sp.]